MNPGGYLVIVLISLILAENIARAQNITLVTSYPTSGFWSSELIRGFQKTVDQTTEIQRRPKPSLDIKELFVDNALGESQPDRIQSKVKKIVTQLQSASTDLVVVFDDEAAFHLGPHLKKLKIKTIFSGINTQPDDFRWDKTTQSVIFESYPIASTLNLLTRMFPKTKRLGVISSQVATSQLIVKEVSKKTRQEGLELANENIFLSSKADEWKKTLSAVNKRVDAIWVLIPYGVTDQTQELPISKVFGIVKDRFKKPTLGIVPGRHTVSVITHPIDLGRQTAEMALDVLAGVPLEEKNSEELKYFQLEVNVKDVKRLGGKIPDDILGIARFIEE